jgi:hypothetical protein
VTTVSSVARPMLNLTNCSFLMSRPNQSARSSFQIISDDPIFWALLSYCPLREHSLSASAHRPDLAPLYAIKTSRTVARAACYVTLAIKTSRTVARTACYVTLAIKTSRSVARTACYITLAIKTSRTVARTACCVTLS